MDPREPTAPNPWVRRLVWLVVLAALAAAREAAFNRNLLRHGRPTPPPRPRPEAPAAG